MRSERPWCVLVDGEIASRRETEAAALESAANVRRAMAKLGENVNAKVVYRPVTQRQRPDSEAK